MTAAQYNFTIEQGATFNPTLRYAQSRFAVKPITAVTNSGQAIVTSTHGLATDWSVYVVGTRGIDMLNHRSDDLRIPSKAYEAYRIDAASLQLDVDTSRFGVYTSGGELLYRLPFDFTGYTARMQIRSSIESTTVIKEITDGAGITLGGVNGTVDLVISAVDATAFAFSSAVYDLEIAKAGVVKRLFYGTFTLSKEVTR